MKQFTVALDGLRFSESSLHYAVYLAKFCNAHLVGAFLDDFTYQSYTFSESANFGEKWEHKMQELNAGDEQTRKLSILRFENICEEADIHYTIHKDKNVAYQELLHETVYSDLLIISGNETFSHAEANGTSGFIREILADTECPVLVAPANYTPLKKILILYDGDPSSVYAAKMFSYLMPGLNPLPIEVLTVKNEKQSLHVPDNRLMKEFMKRHFSDVKYTVLKGEPEEEIVSYLNAIDENTIVVLGAYARSRVSRWFKKSMADHIMSEVNYPVFVAHHR